MKTSKPGFLCMCSCGMCKYASIHVCMCVSLYTCVCISVCLHSCGSHQTTLSFIFHTFYLVWDRRSHWSRVCQMSPRALLVSPSPALRLQAFTIKPGFLIFSLLVWVLFCFLLFSAWFLGSLAMSPEPI